MGIVEVSSPVLPVGMKLTPPTQYILRSPLCQNSSRFVRATAMRVQTACVRVLAVHSVHAAHTYEHGGSQERRSSYLLSSKFPRVEQARTCSELSRLSCGPAGTHAHWLRHTQPQWKLFNPSLIKTQPKADANILHTSAGQIPPKEGALKVKSGKRKNVKKRDAG